MATTQDVIEKYLELRQFCDSFWLRVTERYPADIACQKGCSNCCGLESVCVLEAYILRQYINEHLLLLKKDTGQKDTNFCVLLNEHRCTIYPIRPVICRTHGQPIRSMRLTAGLVDCCPLNFTETDTNTLTSEDILDLDMLTDNLMRLNLAFCMLLGDQELAAERYLLNDILSGNLPYNLTNSEKL